MSIIDYKSTRLAIIPPSEQLSHWLWFDWQWAKLNTISFRVLFLLKKAEKDVKRTRFNKRKTLFYDAFRFFWIETYGWSFLVMGNKAFTWIQKLMATTWSNRCKERYRTNENYTNLVVSLQDRKLFMVWFQLWVYLDTDHCRN